MTIRETLAQIAASMRDEHESGLGAHEIASLLRYVARRIDARRIDAGSAWPVGVTIVGEEGATSIELELSNGLTVAYNYEDPR